MQGYRNPALEIEPHYDQEDDMVYHERHFKSTFEPLVPTKYEGDSIPKNIPPIMTTGKRGKVLPALVADKTSPYYVPPAYQLMEKQGKKKKKKKRSKRKVGNLDHPLEEAYHAGIRTPPTQVQMDTTKMFEAKHLTKQMEHEMGYAKIHPTATEKTSSGISFDLGMFEKSTRAPPHHAKKHRPDDAKLYKVHPLPESRGGNGFELNLTSTPTRDLTNPQDANHRQQFRFKHDESESEF